MEEQNSNFSQSKANVVNPKLACMKQKPTGSAISFLCLSIENKPSTSKLVENKVYFYIYIQSIEKFGIIIIIFYIYWKNWMSI